MKKRALLSIVFAFMVLNSNFLFLFLNNFNQALIIDEKNNVLSDKVNGSSITNLNSDSSEQDLYLLSKIYPLVRKEYFIDSNILEIN